jgi:hypothetical protein
MIQNQEGSIKIFDLEDIKSQSISLKDSLIIAEKEIGPKSWVYTAFPSMHSGCLVYIILLIDPHNNLVKLIIDAGNGKILSKAIIDTKDLGIIQSVSFLLTPSIPIPPPIPLSFLFSTNITSAK